MRNSGMLPPKLNLNNNKDLDKCYGCGKGNPIGLKLKVDWDGETARTVFVPDVNHQGWPGIVHGGIMCSLLDEAMGYVTYYKGLECVTAKFEVRIKCPAPVGKPLLVMARATEESRRLVKVGAKATFEDGKLVAEATGTMYITNH